MGVRTLLRATAATVVACGAGVGAFATTASASTVFKGHGVTIPLDFSTNPMTTLEPPAPLAPLDLTACPFDTTAVFSVTGNVTEHSTENNNGGWGGATLTGIATLTTATAVYQGHLAGWTGGGTNIGPTDTSGQSEAGLEMTFHGVNVANSSQTLTVQIGWHYTANNAGTPTAMNESVNCTS
jgi:hypothetical protein